MTPQRQADAYLAAWRLCAALGIEPELRVPLIDVLCELERAKHEVSLQTRPQVYDQ